ncbi:hypothetical protein [Desulfonatronum thiosulfatophilum]|uniref:hypothetical protein n=1 Tax=Desulfonatronum thiosulfatophilum TaxID=617002 RepID=UPI000B87F329|nr:hypothetical protein [Desulfonatronum thiosulfatophilum]
MVAEAKQAGVRGLDKTTGMTDTFSPSWREAFRNGHASREEPRNTNRLEKFLPRAWGRIAVAMNQRSGFTRLGNQSQTLGFPVHAMDLEPEGRSVWAGPLRFVPEHDRVALTMAARVPVRAA